MGTARYHSQRTFGICFGACALLLCAKSICGLQFAEDETFEGVRCAVTSPLKLKLKLDWEGVLFSLMNWFLGAYIFTYLNEWLQGRDKERLFHEQPTRLGVSRINISLNTFDVANGYFEMRTLSEQPTESCFPIDAERSLLLDAAEDLDAADGPESLNGLMQLKNEDAALRLQNTFKNHISAISCAGHLAADMGDTSVTTKSYVFGVTYETQGAKQDARKIRVLLVQEDNLKNMQPRSAPRPAPRKSPRPKRKSSGRSINTALDDASELPPKRRCVVRPDLTDQAVKYFEDRYDTLMKMRDMVIAEGDAGAVQEMDGEQQRRLLIGKVFITAQITQ